MDTKAVKTFVVLSETLNYQQAAQRLSYAPSTLTGHIHTLEQELGVKLFTKVGRQLELTEEGRGFQESAQRLLMDYDLALRSVVRTDEELTLGIAGCELIATYAFSPFFDSFLRRCPHIQLSILQYAGSRDHSQRECGCGAALCPQPPPSARTGWDLSLQGTHQPGGP